MYQISTCINVCWAYKSIQLSRHICDEILRKVEKKNPKTVTWFIKSSKENSQMLLGFPSFKRKTARKVVATAGTISIWQWHKHTFELKALSSALAKSHGWYTFIHTCTRNAPTGTHNNCKITLVSLPLWTC